MTPSTLRPRPRGPEHSTLVGLKAETQEDEQKGLRSLVRTMGTAMHLGRTREHPELESWKKIPDISFRYLQTESYTYAIKTSSFVSLRMQNYKNYYINSPISYGPMLRRLLFASINRTESFCYYVNDVAHNEITI